MAPAYGNVNSAHIAIQAVHQLIQATQLVRLLQNKCSKQPLQASPGLIWLANKYLLLRRSRAAWRLWLASVPRSAEGLRLKMEGAKKQADATCSAQARRQPISGPAVCKPWHLPF